MFTSRKDRHSPIQVRRTFEALGKRPLRVEELETRTLLSGFGPAQIRTAYGFNQLPYTGSGVTIAIVDAYDDPNISGDLAKFDTSYGLSAPPSFVKATPQGLPAASKGWSSEIAIDVEWAHAVAPGANILLVEAANNSFTALLSAVDYAAQRAQVVSMSWGGGEFSGELSYDYHFNVSGVTFVAASGDSGRPPEWPATSPYVLSVGGTSLTASSGGTWNGETGWSSSSGGASSYEPKPSYQNDELLTRHHRGNPDVAYDANPGTGVYIYDSYGSGGWAQYGGTSIGAPQWAGLIALADQGRAALTGYTQVLPALYQIYGSSSYSTYFHDIVSGSNGYSAGPGYDFVTGIGTPKANYLVPYLRGLSGAGAAAAAGTSATGVRGVAPTEVAPNARLLTIVSATTASSASITGSSVKVGSQAEAGTPVPAQSSVLPLATSVRQSDSRVDGGGANAALWSDKDASQEMDWLSPMSNGGAAPDATLAAPDDSAMQARLVPILGPAREEYFADDTETASLAGGATESSPLMSEDIDLVLNPATGATLLAAMLGFYWSAPSEEVEQRGDRLRAR
jgi:hypothetical protein